MIPTRRTAKALRTAAKTLISLSIGGASLTWVASASAQEPADSSTKDTGPDTLLSDLTVEHGGWYLAPAFGVTTIQGHLAFTSGARGAWRINRSFGIGLAGAGLASDGVRIDDSAEGMRRDWQGGYGGVLFEWVIGSNHAVHGLLDATVGAGGGCVDTYSDGSGCKDGRGFFLAEPTANVEVNVLTFMRVSLGGGYRAALGPDKAGVASRDLSGFVARVAVEFGEF